jgi:hypothetical protein
MGPRVPYLLLYVVDRVVQRLEDATVRTLIRAGILVAAAAGFALALSSGASADVVEPQSAYQPASIGLLDQEAAKAAKIDPAPAEPTAVAEEKVVKPDEVVAATPAPEQVVRPAPAHLVREMEVKQEAPSVVERVFHPFRAGLQRFGASLVRVVSACDVGLGTGTGGPVFVLAVLSMAAPFIRRRVVGTRWSTDEDMPEFLYAAELTPPG